MTREAPGQEPLALEDFELDFSDADLSALLAPTGARPPDAAADRRADRGLRFSAARPAKRPPGPAARTPSRRPRAPVGRRTRGGVRFLRPDFGGAKKGPSIGPTGAGDLAPSRELYEVTRRISLHLLDVLVTTARTLLAGGMDRDELHQLIATLDSLRRLADAAREDTQRRSIDRMAAEARRFEASPNGRARERFRVRLRDWVVEFGGALGDGEGQRLRALVEYDPREVPLFAELARLHGVGPRRLRRLFAAGLHSVEVVARARAEDLSAVTGLPRGLAEDVIRRAQAFETEEKRRAIFEMQARLTRFSSAVDELGEGPELRAAAAAAIDQMQRLIEQLHGRSRT